MFINIAKCILWILPALTTSKYVKLVEIKCYKSITPCTDQNKHPTKRWKFQIWSNNVTIFPKRTGTDSFPMGSEKSLQADLSLRWAHRSLCWFCNEGTQLLLTKAGTPMLRWHHKRTCLESNRPAQLKKLAKDLWISDIATIIITYHAI